MLKALIRFSLNNSGLVIVASGLLLLIAGLKLRDIPVDVFPELNAPTVVILTESGGLSADEVEQYVSIPVESSMAGLSGVRRVRSASAISLSIVWIEFDWGEDLYRARQLVAEQLASVAESLPEEAHPEIAPMTSITGEIMLLSLSGDLSKVSAKELRALAEFDIRNRLRAVPGVAQVV
ncbi:MAG: efflux RND transporter permease subunit, partial [Planctomycetes bacterium]|nr:efflux RND transporter permease subunit [Planctomycetota bacterium]